MPPFRGGGLRSGGARVGPSSFRGVGGRYIRGPGGTIFDQIGPRLDAGPAIARETIASVLDFYQSQVQEWMQENAPWEDRDTPHSYAGEARDGLTAEVQETLGSASLFVYHTVDYGVWLEVRWSGRYAILLPTVEEWGPHLMAEMAVFG